MQFVKSFIFLLTFIFVNFSYGQNSSPTCRQFKIDPGVESWTECTAISRKDVVAYLSASKKPKAFSSFYFGERSVDFGDGNSCCERATAAALSQCEYSAAGTLPPRYENIKKYCYVESCTCVDYSSK